MGICRHGKLKSPVSCKVLYHYAQPARDLMVDSVRPINTHLLLKLINERNEN